MQKLVQFLERHPWVIVAGTAMLVVQSVGVFEDACRWYLWVHKNAADAAKNASEALGG